MMENQPRKVEHNYHDYSQEQESPADSTAGGKEESTNRNEQNFPVKLHYMLSELEKDGMDYIVSWQPHGRCFVVHKQNEFVEKILPYWFRQTKFASFQRQLNLYGFKRLTNGPDKGGYYHELFLRSKRFLSHRIARLKIKGEGARKPSSPETEPNFYAAPYLPLTKNGDVPKPAAVAEYSQNALPAQYQPVSLQPTNTGNVCNTVAPVADAALSLRQLFCSADAAGLPIGYAPIPNFPHAPTTFLDFYRRNELNLGYQPTALPMDFGIIGHNLLGSANNFLATAHQKNNINENRGNETMFGNQLGNNNFSTRFW